MRVTWAGDNCDHIEGNQEWVEHFSGLAIPKQNEYFLDQRIGNAKSNIEAIKDIIPKKQQIIYPHHQP